MKSLFSIAGLSRNRRLHVFLVAIILFWTGCGGGGTSSTNVPGPGGIPLPPASAQIKVGDAPADGVVSFELTINSIALNPVGGGTPVTILSTPTRTEITHTSGTFEPLAVANVPQGSYASATVTVSNPEIVIINPVTRLPQPLSAVLPSATITVNFPSPITVGVAAAVLTFDLNLAGSVAIAGNTATVTPTFIVALSGIAAQNQQVDDNGKIEDITGVVTGVSGNSFTISVEQHATPMVFTVDATTVFQAPLANLSSLSVGKIVEVDAVTMSSGALLALKVSTEFEVENGLELEGFVSSVTGTPVTQFQLVVHKSSTASTTAPALGSVLTVNVAANTNFKIADDHVDLTGLAFPFNASSLKPGQKVEVDVEPPIPASPTAKKVILKRQTLTGVISNLNTTGTSTATFTLMLDASFSAFALVSNQATVNVFRQPGTELKNLTTLSNGQNIRVRGLVFFDTSSSSYKMVAGRIMQ